ncbi:MAG: hypothetical protein Kow0090_02780 [Myxococcota bacterium]
MKIGVKSLLPLSLLWAFLLPLYMQAEEDGVKRGKSALAIKNQENFRRVKTARAAKGGGIDALFGKIGLKYPPERVFLRIYKEEGELEVWAKEGQKAEFIYLKSYKVCAKSGKLGPKRRAGDLQVPEGFYEVILFNPWSSYRLSMKINYPNASDRILGNKFALGGEIFIHGKCVTIGCVPIGDDGIDELYIIALDTFKSGGRVNVHIFPMKMTDENRLKLAEVADGDEALLGFWENLREGFLFFETNRYVPKISVDKKGKYIFK